jgi:hypothetical protein
MTKHGSKYALDAYWTDLASTICARDNDLLWEISLKCMFRGVAVDNGNPEPEPSGKDQCRDTRFAAATATDPSHSFKTDPVNE